MQSTLKRPKLISIVCILGYVWIVFSFPGVFSPTVKKLGDWYPALFGLMVATNFISYIGVWHMKKWGVQLYLITFFIKQLVLLLLNDISYIEIVFSFFFIVVFFVYYKEMNDNL